MNAGDLLKERNFRFEKKFGQNFITDKNLLAAIAADSGFEPGETALEIGAGAGTLTRALSEAASEVVAFEIDRRLEGIISDVLSGKGNVKLIFEDICKVPDDRIDCLVGDSYRLVANLPYYITTPVIMRFVERENRPRGITVMVQKEVGDRLVAAPGTAEYGAITASVALDGDAGITRTVSRHMFRPVPGVDSCVVNIKMHSRYNKEEKRAARRLIRAAFAMRRKTLINNFASALGIEKERTASALGAIGRKADLRGETLGADEFVQLAKILYLCR